MRPPSITIFPEQASTLAPRVDALFYFLSVISVLVSLLIVAIIFYFAIRYRKLVPGRPEGPYAGQALDAKETKRLEIAWLVPTVLVFMAIFWWGASLFAAIYTPPADTMDIYVVGKQWMWKMQHIGGKREINELHVPRGRPVRLIMTSEDVIHDFFVPAFRVKADVLPGRYTTLWFEPTKVGEYHLFCAEYCGTKHSEMVGKVIVLEPRDYETWLEGGPQRSLAEAGAELFDGVGCNTCHNDAPDARGPRLDGLYGSTVQLADGSTVVADESYLRESILNPRGQIVAGFQPLMPTYDTQLDEEKVIQLVEYIKSLKGSEAAAPPPTAEPEPPVEPDADAGSEEAGTEDAADGAAPAPAQEDAPAQEETGRVPAEAPPEPEQPRDDQP